MEKTRKYRNYTDEDVIRIAKESTSLAQLLEKLDLTMSGGNYANMKKILHRLKVDTTHWNGQGWSKDKQLKDWTGYSRIAPLKKHLLVKRGHKCEECLGETWMNKPMPLEIHHKDGDRTNNSEDNLQILCCNCHSLTDNWRNRKRNKKE
jgi:hypothetical protein